MKKLIWILVILFLLGIGVGAYLYKAIFTPNISLENTDTTLLYLPNTSDYIQLKDSLLHRKIINNEESFDLVASLMKYKVVKPGMYKVVDGWSNKELISVLRSGQQEPVNLTFNNVRTIEELSGFFAKKLEPDSISLLNYFLSEEVYKKYNVTPENTLSLFIPNTYQFYWNSSPEKILTRMGYEHDKFYTEKRKQKLEDVGLSESEAYTLASIVQKETLVNTEKPRVAGVYINRLRRGQLLQADPTVVFASGDFGLRRVLNKHLAIDSPYNTYKYEGLPPGPIAMPDVSTIDAVLNFEEHRYLYFCASPDNSGRHIFAKTLIEHNRNANKYRAYLNKKRIFR